MADKHTVTKKYKSMGKLTLQVLIPVMVLFLGIIAVMFQSMLEARQLVYRYIEDTARLYVEQINTDIVKINYEVITLVNKNEKNYSLLEESRPDNSKYFPYLTDIMEQNRNLKIRYKEPCCFYLYLDRADMMILDSGTIFTDSQAEGVNEPLRTALREKNG